MKFPRCTMIRGSIFLLAICEVGIRGYLLFLKQRLVDIVERDNGLPGSPAMRNTVDTALTNNKGTAIENYNISKKFDIRSHQHEYL